MALGARWGSSSAPRPPIKAHFKTVGEMVDRNGLRGVGVLFPTVMELDARPRA